MIKTDLAQAVPTIGFGELENKAAPRFAGGGIGDIVSVLILYLFPIAGLLLLLYLLYGGFRWMTSGGDPKALAQARSAVTTALIGFVIVFVSFWVVQLVGIMLGIDAITVIFK
ncbi:MAG: hypothetical protein BMS9Abin21_145 [Thermodesulfovibrionia bacterium]|nr:MAG: hypothetical protein BMS9Abin21_145 [Thermodesulfovibrionia bacterium]